MSVVGCDLSSLYDHVLSASRVVVVRSLIFFFFNDTATTEIYTLSLHDALPIFRHRGGCGTDAVPEGTPPRPERSEEHTSELQSRVDLVCRLLLEKKKKTKTYSKVKR